MLRRNASKFAMRARPASRKGVTLTPCPLTQQRNLSGVFMHKIMTRSEAIELGLKRYFTGKPCRRGHVTTRKVSDKSCRECNRLNQAKRREQPEIVEAERNRDRQKWATCENRRKSKSESDKKRRSSDHFLELQRKIDRLKYNNDPAFRDRKIAQACRYSKQNREKINKRNRLWFKEKYKTDKKFKAAHVARSMVHRTLSATKKEKEGKTFCILGYTKDDLVTHIERQFSKGMSWGNYGEWHIDHIVPVSWHVKNGETDPKIINALTNLRPMWAKENNSKGKKKDFLL